MGSCARPYGSDGVEHATGARATVMGGSYKQCSECGKRALSIATRCPGCGRALLAPAARKVDPSLHLRRFLSPRVVGGIIAAAVVLTVAELARSSHPPDQQSSFVVADSTSAFSEVAYTPAAAAPLDTATATPLPAAGAGGVLVARTWTNVRKSRSKRAGVEAVLLPRDTVLADSLERGWYRVALDGEVLGYVHRSTLARP
jgi:hypothetical protein